VETQAKKRYNQIASALLKKGEEEELAEKLEMLRLFLESTDFSKLRGEYEKHLRQGKRVKVILYLEEGKPKHQMKVI
jgi:hypothetical protein